MRPGANRLRPLGLEGCAMDQRVNGCPHPKPRIPFPDIQPRPTWSPDGRPEESVRIVPRLCDSSLHPEMNTRDKDSRCSGTPRSEESVRIVPGPRTRSPRTRPTSPARAMVLTDSSRDSKTNTRDKPDALGLR